MEKSINEDYISEDYISEDYFDSAMRVYFVSAEFEGDYEDRSEMRVMATSMKDAAIIFSGGLGNEEKFRMLDEDNSKLLLTVTDADDSSFKCFYLGFEIRSNVEEVIR
jgi:hypothetical protein